MIDCIHIYAHKTIGDDDGQPPLPRALQSVDPGGPDDGESLPPPFTV